MNITVHSSKSVKPAASGDRNAQGSFHDGSVIPLSVFDKVTYTEYHAGIYAFHPPAPPNAALEAGLAKVLPEYREFAGRLGTDAGGNISSILLNDAGVRFVEATADAALGSVMPPLEMGPEALGLFPHGGDEEEAELLLVQLTRFSCGSLVVSCNVCHTVADGPAIGNFMLAWGHATRGLDPPFPVVARDSASFLFAPRDPPRVEFEHRGVEEAVIVHRVHFSLDSISKFKSQASASHTAQIRSYSTLKCVAAHLWRCVTKARGIHQEEATTKMHIAVNGRVRMRCPPVPAGHTGNVVLWACPATKAAELLEMPLGDAVELVAAEVARIDDAYFRSFIDFACSGAVERERLVPTADSAELALSPDVEVNSLLGMPFYDLDFGSGRPFFFVPSFGDVPVEGAIYVVPSFVGDGSVDAYVPLFRRHVNAFNKSAATP